MESLLDFGSRFAMQLQTPALAFLIGGMLLAALGSRLRIPDAIYKFAVFMLLMRIGLKGGMKIRESEILEMLLPAAFAVIIGIMIVLLGRYTLALLPGVKREDGIATAGLFGAVSGSTLAAAMVMLEAEGMTYEAWAPALYPFMDIPALILAIVLAHVYRAKRDGNDESKVRVWEIIKESLQGSALSAMLLGLALGLFSRPDNVFDSFYDPLFRGLLSVLLLTMGMEAYTRLSELKRVAHWYMVYAVCAPIVHGFVGFGFGMIAHHWVGFSPGGVVMLAIISASNSDISGPPTLRAGIPSANPSAYIGSSTSIGTPVALAICIPLFVALAEAAF